MVSHLYAIKRSSGPWRNLDWDLEASGDLRDSNAYPDQFSNFLAPSIVWAYTVPLSTRLLRIFGSQPTRRHCDEICTGGRPHSLLSSRILLRMGPNAEHCFCTGFVEPGRSDWDACLEDHA